MGGITASFLLQLDALFNPSGIPLVEDGFIISLVIIQVIILLDYITVPMLDDLYNKIAEKE